MKHGRTHGMTVPYGEESLQARRQVVPPLASAYVPISEAYPANEEQEQGTDGNSGTGDPRVGEMDQHLN